MSLKASKKKLPHLKQSASSYANFVTSVEFVWIGMVSSSFSGDRNAYFENQEHRRSIEWSCKLSDLIENCFELRSEFGLKLLEPKSDKCFFDLRVDHVVHFHATSGFNKAAIQKFADSDGRIVAWPFIREYVTDTCGRMHVPPIILPFGSLGE